MDNSDGYITSFQNYTDRKFCRTCHLTNRIFYIAFGSILFLIWFVDFDGFNLEFYFRPIQLEEGLLLYFLCP